MKHPAQALLPRTTRPLGAGRWTVASAGWHQRWALRCALLLSIGVSAGQPVQAAPASPAPPTAAAAAAAPKEPARRAMDEAQLFYQLLMGELFAADGEPQTAFDFMLDAARRSREAAAYKRAADIALQARSGERVLVAAQAWRQAFPESVEANSYLVRMLSIAGRSDEALEPLQHLLKATPEADRADLISALPRFFSRNATGGGPAALKVLEALVAPYIQAGGVQAAAAHACMGRAHLLNADTALALSLAEKAHSLAPQAPYGAQLALEIRPQSAGTQALAQAHLQAQPDSLSVRLQWARVLSEARQYGQAAEQLEIAVAQQADKPEPWLTLGALYVQLLQPERAVQALQNHLDKAPSPATAESQRARRQAHLLLSRAHEMRGQWEQAEQVLNRLGEAQPSLEVAQRRAFIRAGQGQIEEARALIRQAPARNAQEAVSKFSLEAELLREQRMWLSAYQVLSEGIAIHPEEVDLLYEHAMAAQRLDRLGEMEAGLRKVIALKPDHAHAYNALGYSLAERNIRLEEARSLLRKATELAPEDPFITDSLGWLEYRTGSVEEAARLLALAYKMRPDPEIGAHLGEVYWVKGDQAAALQVWRESIARDPGNEVLKETLQRFGVKP
jgi:tetratricopeptide (TPR) repeat protein